MCACEDVNSHLRVLSIAVVQNFESSESGDKTKDKDNDGRSIDIEDESRLPRQVQV